MRHAQQVALSEAEALQTLGLAPDAGPHIAVGVNADSLATWFVAAMADAVQMAPMTFDVHVEDQDHSAHLLREGRVMAALTVSPARAGPTPNSSESSGSTGWVRYMSAYAATVPP